MRKHFRKSENQQFNLTIMETQKVDFLSGTNKFRANVSFIKYFTFIIQRFFLSAGLTALYGKFLIGNFEKKKN